MPITQSTTPAAPFGVHQVGALAMWWLQSPRKEGTVLQQQSAVISHTPNPQQHVFRLTYSLNSQRNRIHAALLAGTIAHLTTMQLTADTHVVPGAHSTRGTEPKACIKSLNGHTPSHSMDTHQVTQ